MKLLYSLSFFYIMICWNIYKLLFSFYLQYMIFIWFSEEHWYDILYKFESTNIYGTN